jgi:hypothetical protein
VQSGYQLAGSRGTRELDGHAEPQLDWRRVMATATVEAGASVYAGLHEDARELLAKTPLALDDWQADALDKTVEVDEDGKWTHMECGLVVPRQNGKGGFIEGRKLVAIFLDPLCKRIVYSAHEFGTALDAMQRMVDILEASPDLEREILKVIVSNGKEGITFRNGTSLRYKTRTRSGGRGLTGDLLFLDEAMILKDVSISALVPILSARPNAQLIYTGSAVDRNTHEHGRVLSRVRARGRRGDEPGLLYVEYTADPEMSLADALDHPSILDDCEAWARANPAYPHRIGPAAVEMERRAMSDRGFAVERLGLGDWFREDETDALIDPAHFLGLLDADSSPQGVPVLAFDVTPQRSASAVAIVGKRADGLLHAEVIDTRPGTAGLVDYIAAVVAAQGIRTVRCNGGGGAASLVPALAAHRITVEQLSGPDIAAAAGELFDAITQSRLRWRDSPTLPVAVNGAVMKQLGERWAFGRASASIDISPLVAVSAAAWAADTAPAPEPYVLDMDDDEDPEDDWLA